MTLWSEQGEKKRVVAPLYFPCSDRCDVAEMLHMPGGPPPKIWVPLSEIINPEAAGIENHRC